MGPAHIPPPAVRDLLAPLLPALPAAAFSPQPGPAILPLLSPILRQRVQVFSVESKDPWLRLLCYDSAKGVALGEAARSGDLEPHPVSGEVEIDWDYDVETRYRRLDVETLQALVVLKSLGIVFQLLYCTGDNEGGPDGWRVSEVTVPDKPSPFSTWGGMGGLAEAEADFKEKEHLKKAAANHVHNTNHDSLSVGGWNSSTAPADECDDDDDYWARYDATPARTPATKRSPVPAGLQESTTRVETHEPSTADDSYFAQYDDVQPAMDNHDPDEAEAAAALAPSSSEVPCSAPPIAKPVAVAPPLGLAVPKVLRDEAGDPMSADADETNRVWTLVEKETRSPSGNEGRIVDLVHPRPASSASTNGSRMVAKLEESAGKQEQSEFGVKQHVSRTVRSLFMLSKAAGIDREEFERLVKTELDMLDIVDQHV